MGTSSTGTNSINNGSTRGGPSLGTEVTTTAEGGMIPTDFAQLFGDIDWATANFGELAENWRKELTELEMENIHSLIELSQKTANAQYGVVSTGTTSALVNILNRAREETGTVASLLEEYCQQLQQMGSEIAQIEQVNRALTIQSNNQTALLCELDQLLEQLVLPRETIQILEGTIVTLEEPGNVPRIAQAAVAVHQLLYGSPRQQLEEKGLLGMTAVTEQFQYYGEILRKFLDHLKAFFLTAFTSYAEKYFADRSTTVTGGRSSWTSTTGGGSKSKTAGIKMAAFDDLIPFLEAYAILLSGLYLLDARKHQEIMAGYQQQMAAIFKRDFGDFVEYLRANRLVKKAAEDKTHLFVSLSHHGDRLMGSVTSMISGGAASNLAPSAPSSTPSTPIGRCDYSSMDPFELHTFPSLDSGEHLVPGQALHFLIISLTLLMEQQQSVAARIFYGLDERCEDERLLKLVDSSVMAIFVSMDEVLSFFLEAILKVDNSSSIEMIVTLDQRIPQLQDNLPVLAKFLTALKRRLLVAAEAFINDQVTVIDATKFSARKRSGIFPFVALFPVFIQKTEETLRGLKSTTKTTSSAREIVNKGYEKITAAIFRSLDALAVQAEQGADEKERINASVMNIQNGQFLVSQLNNLRGLTGTAVEVSLTMAQARYDRHLALYAAFSLHRVFGRLMDFFAGIDTQLTTVPPEEVAFHPNFNKASARRVLTAFPAKEIKKGLEAVYGRVIKHFEGDSTLQQTVWRAIQDEFLRENKQWEAHITRVYPEGGGDPVQLAYTLKDALAYFGEISALSSHHMTG